MPQSGTDSFAARQAARRRRANLDAASAVFWQVLSAAALLWVRVRFFAPGGLPRLILLIAVLVDLAMIFPVFIVRHQRIKEIAGGEEDEARQY